MDMQIISTSCWLVQAQSVHMSKTPFTFIVVGGYICGHSKVKCQVKTTSERK